MDTRLVLEGLVQTLWMVVPSALLAALFGLVLGVTLVAWHPTAPAPRPLAYRTLGGLVNAGRSLPFIIVLVLAIPISRLLTGTSIGATAAIVPLTLAATPLAARLVEGALLEVPRGTVEAARAFGATPLQTLLFVLLPEARPALVRAFTVALVNLLGASAMAGAIGGGGLGDLAIRYGYQRFDSALLAATVIALVSLVQLAQWAGEELALSVDHRLQVARAAGRRFALVLGLALCAVVAAWLVLGGAGATQALRILRVGASPTPHAEILEVARPLLARRGVDLQIRVFNDYVHPNLALGDGSIDANFFQHRPYLDAFQERHPLGIVASTPVFVAPMALYSARLRAVNALSRGATIAIPNDPSNASRALALLQKAGLITLSAGVSMGATLRDVHRNPRALVIKELDAAQLPHALPDVDAAVMNTNYALQAHLSPRRDGLLVEAVDSPYANVLAARPAVMERPEFRELARVLTGPEVRAFILRRFEGSIVPVP